MALSAPLWLYEWHAAIYTERFPAVIHTINKHSKILWKIVLPEKGRLNGTIPVAFLQALLCSNISKDVKCSARERDKMQEACNKSFLVASLLRICLFSLTHPPHFPPLLLLLFLSPYLALSIIHIHILPLSLPLSLGHCETL